MKDSEASGKPQNLFFFCAFCSAHSPVCDLVPNFTIWSMELPYSNKLSFFLPLAAPFAENSFKTSFWGFQKPKSVIFVQHIKLEI